MTFKQIIPTLLFYAVAIATVYILNKFSPGGPCSPGLGVVAFFLLLPVVAVLLIRNIYLAVKVDKLNTVNVVLHFVALILASLLLR